MEVEIENDLLAPIKAPVLTVFPEHSEESSQLLLPTQSHQAKSVTIVSPSQAASSLAAAAAISVIPNPVEISEKSSKIPSPSPNPSPELSTLDRTKKKLVDELELELGIIDRGARANGRGSKRYHHPYQQHQHQSSQTPPPPPPPSSQSQSHQSQPKPTKIAEHDDVSLDDEEVELELHQNNNLLGNAEEGRVKSSRNRISTGAGTAGGPQFDETVTENPCITFRRPYPNVKFFLFTFILGFILALFGIIVLYKEHFQQFVFYYTVGSVITFFGMIFLMSPRKQLENLHITFPAMCMVIIIISFMGVFACALNLSYIDGALISFCIQYSALSCYSVFYIPTAQAALSNMCSVFDY